MKVYFPVRSAARSFKSRLGESAKVVDAKNAPSVNGSRWAVDVKRKNVG